MDSLILLSLVENLQLSKSLIDELLMHGTAYFKTNVNKSL